MPPVNGNPTGPLDSDGRVQMDLACVRCGYNLRTLAADGLCPECALPVARSIRGDLLKYADPTWVGKLTDGAEFLFMAALAPLVAAPAAGLGFTLSDSWPAIGGVLLLIAMLAGIVTVFGAPVGFLAITAREPRISLRPEGVSARRVCRYGLLVGAVILGVAALSSSFAPGWIRWWSSRVCVLIALVLVLAVFPLSFLRHLASLLRRVPAEDLAGTARAIALVVCAVDLLLILPVSAELLTGGAIGIAEGCLVGVAAVFGGVCYLVGLYVLNGARKRFRQAANEAVANAAQSQHPNGSVSRG
jgi:MFS family permease